MTAYTKRKLTELIQAHRAQQARNQAHAVYCTPPPPKIPCINGDAAYFWKAQIYQREFQLKTSPYVLRPRKRKNKVLTLLCSTKQVAKSTSNQTMQSASKVLQVLSSSQSCAIKGRTAASPQNPTKYRRPKAIEVTMDSRAAWYRLINERSKVLEVLAASGALSKTSCRK